MHVVPERKCSFLIRSDWESFVTQQCRVNDFSLDFCYANAVISLPGGEGAVIMI